MQDSPVRTKAQYEYHDTARQHSSIAYKAGIQTATDAYELISSLRSEVAALERHRDALQSKLECLEETAAVSPINNTVATAVIERAPISHRNGGEGTVKTAMRSRPAAEATGVASGGATPAGARVVSNLVRERQARRKDRRARAAVILLQFLQGGEGPREGRRWTRGSMLRSTDGATMPTTGDEDITVLAAAAKRKREQRHRAQETFASRKAEEVR